MPLLCSPLVGVRAFPSFSLHNLALRSFRTAPTRFSQPKSSKLPSTPARTRFAPSPTGSLHLGSLRTATYNYLLARATNGSFLLRLEDTDAKRTIPGAEQSLYSDLLWAGLSWDEGPIPHGSVSKSDGGVGGGAFGPYRQSERTALYREHAQRLLDSGAGYRCFCSAERLDELARRRRALGMPTDYDRSCAHIPAEEAAARAEAGESHVVRLKAPDAYPPFTDLVYGKIGRDGGGFNAGVTMKHGEVAYEDPVLLKSDGTPTYHLANVVDDHLMEITHVVRASEWLPSTPKHLALYKAFGWTPPVFAHVGLLTDSEGRKLSKRQMDVGVVSWKEKGVLSQSLVNFAALLGWSHTKRSDIMNLQEMVENFTMKFTKGNATVDEGKLWFLQRAHVEKVVKNSSECDTARKDLDGLLDRLIPVLKQRHGDECKALHEDDSLNLRQYAEDILLHDARNYTLPEAFIERNLFFFKQTSEQPSLPQWLLDNPGQARTLAQTAQDALAMVLIDRQWWSHDHLEQAMKSSTMALAQRESPNAPENVKQAQKNWYKLLCKYLRWALLEGHDGPGLARTMAILGKNISLQRISNAKKALEATL